MLESLRHAFGAEPHDNEDGTYWPSKAAMAIAVPDKTEYHPVEYDRPYTGDRKVLVLCTEESQLRCENGKVFRTGNHPTEIFVVVKHLEAAGFTVDFATPSGQPVAIEEFAVPHADAVTSDAMTAHAEQLSHPLAMPDVLAGLGDDSPYLAVYLPGGHGAVLGNPFSETVRDIIEWFVDTDKHVITICHGPALLVSLDIGRQDGSPNPLSGYTLVAFTDSGDRMLTKAGYLPGEMPWFFNERIESLGIKIANHLTIGGTHVDRKLLSGDSPMAGDKLGKLAASTLLAAVSKG
ncbi:MAG: DJ-1/PfpI family protein [Actinomycetales bacterium]